MTTDTVLEIKLDASSRFFVECMAEHLATQPSTSKHQRESFLRAVESLRYGRSAPGVISIRFPKN